MPVEGNAVLIRTIGILSILDLLDEGGVGTRHVEVEDVGLGGELSITEPSTALSLRAVSGDRLKVTLRSSTGDMLDLWMHSFPW
jgi:hypothetical protein